MLMCFSLSGLNATLPKKFIKERADKNISIPVKIYKLPLSGGRGSDPLI
jgi:hypothetical protein